MEENIKIKVEQVKRKQTEMNGAVKNVIEKHNQCRDELPRRFITTVAFSERKDEVNKSVDKIMDKLEPIHLDIELIKKQLVARE